MLGRERTPKVVTIAEEPYSPEPNMPEPRELTLKEYQEMRRREQVEKDLKLRWALLGTGILIGGPSGAVISGWSLLQTVRAWREKRRGRQDS